MKACHVVRKELEKPYSKKKMFIDSSRRGVNTEEEGELLKLKYYTVTTANKHIQVLISFNLEIIIPVFPIDIAWEDMLDILR